ncbi:MAG: response regulator [Phycisphaerae bacterium]|nr:response regulator [Phycisphaerae bacterium]
MLVIDDEPTVREVLTDALRQADLEVCSAASAAEAIELAAAGPVDLVVADLVLGDGNGADVVEQLRSARGADVPVVVITGHSDSRALTEASRIRPVEMMTKPVDLDHLRQTIRAELTRQADHRRLTGRNRRLRHLAHQANRKRKQLQQELESSAVDVEAAWRAQHERLSFQQTLIEYQAHLLRAKNDDDVFKELFRAFVRRSGGVFGVAMVCNADAELRVVGRFGVPRPDGLQFCQHIVQPIVNLTLVEPRVMTFEAAEQIELFDPAIRKYLAGVSILAIPLMPAPGELIGLVVLYRKGEQPFTDEDIALAELTGHSSALAIERND